VDSPKPATTWQFLLTRRSFTQLTTARFISSLGDQFHLIATMLLVQRLTGSALAMGSVMIANTIPRIVFSLIGGVSVDRYDRKRILVLADVVRAISVGLLVALALTNHLQVWQVALFAAINGTATSFYSPAVSAATPGIVPREELQKANAVSSIIVRLAGVIGPAMGGLIIGVSGLWIGYTVDAASFAISAALILGITIPKLETKQKMPGGNFTSVWSDLKDGVSYILKSPVALPMVLLSTAIAAAALPVAQLLPGFAKNDLILSNPQSIGFLWSAMTLGMFLGPLFLNSVYPIPNKTLGMLLSAILFGGGMVGLGLLRFYYVSLACIIVMGFGMGISLVLSTTLFQAIVPKEMLGRFFANSSLIILGLQPLIMAAAGWAADASSASLIFIICGSLLLAISFLWSLQYPKLNRSVRNLI
jgi:DHA3 family tetracycline resistance protein-like MFS transporter